MTPRGWRRLRLLLPLLLLAAAGCLGGTQNPSYFPFWLPAGPIIRTHAKPPGRGNFADFDPKAFRLEVRPLRSTNPVRTEHLVIATVLDDDGQPRRKRRVEWMLEGVGSILEVDESGYLAGRGYKVDNRYAVSYTDYFEHTITRGNDNPDDDFVIKPGQSWCIITSAVEGDSQLTVYAPEIFDHDHRTAVVTTHWVDAQWQFPAAATARAGNTQVLTTNLFRHSDRAPLPNYRVRYSLLDGPPAQLLPDRGREAVVASDQSGRASVNIGQLAVQPGVNRIGVEVLRPADPLNPNSPPVVVAKSETSIDWQAPQISVTVEAPKSVPVGQEYPATVVVTNTGKVESQVGDVSIEIPPGMSYVRATPDAVVGRDSTLTWRLGSLGAGREQRLEATFKSRDVGSFKTTARVKTADNLEAEKAAELRVDKPQLKITIDPTKVAMVGESVGVPITVTNPGSGPAANLTVEVLLPDGVEVPTPNGTVRNKVSKRERDPLGPGEKRTIALRVVPRKPGKLSLAVRIQSDDGLEDSASTTLDVQEPKVRVTRNGPAEVFVNREGTWAVTVTNIGSVPLTNAGLREKLPPELAFRSATDGGQYNAAAGEVVWNFGTLQPGEDRVVRYTAAGSRLTTRGILSGTVTAYPNVEQKSENKVVVLGVPAVRVEVSGDTNPVEAGARANYTIRVVNLGTLPANQIEIDALARTDNLRITTARGGAGARVNDQRAEFAPINDLQPGQAVTLSVSVQAVKEGDARFRVEARTQTSPQPIVEEVATRVIPAPNRR